MTTIARTATSGYTMSVTLDADPAVMSLLDDGDEMFAVATDARSRLSAALQALATDAEEV